MPRSRIKYLSQENSIGGHTITTLFIIIEFDNIQLKCRFLEESWFFFHNIRMRICLDFVIVLISGNWLQRFNNKMDWFSFPSGISYIFEMFFLVAKKFIQNVTLFGMRNNMQTRTLISKENFLRLLLCRIRKKLELIWNWTLSIKFITWALVNRVWLVPQIL